MIDKALAHIRKQHITIGMWMTGLVGVMLVRFILESLSNPSGRGAMDLISNAHYVLFFVAITLGLMCIVRFFSKDEPTTVAKMGLFGLMVIWVSPLVDLATTAGKGRYMAYLNAGSFHGLILDFCTFFGLDISQGITLGMRAEIAILLCVIGLYVWASRKKMWPVIGAIISSYSLIFVILSIPGIIYVISTINFSAGSGYTEPLVLFFARAIVDSNIAHNTIPTIFAFSSYQSLLDGGLGKIMIQILYIWSLLATFAWFWSTQHNKLFAVIKNSRPERIGFYVSLLFGGMGFAYLSSDRLFLSSWVDWMSVVVLILSLCSAWVYSVHMNDLADISIDTISNPTRPLIQGSLTARDMQESAHILLASALLGSFAAGYFPFFMTVLFLSTYHIYSTPPLRLKCVPILSPFLISVAVLATVLSGYFFISPDKNFHMFPISLAVGIMVVFTLAVNVRDVKDIAGDRAEGINTLPILFGKDGIRITGLLFATSFLLIPVFLSFRVLYVIAIPAAIIGYKFVLRKPYKENYIFMLYFAFFYVASFLFILSYYKPDLFKFF